MLRSGFKVSLELSLWLWQSSDTECLGRSLPPWKVRFEELVLQDRGGRRKHWREGQSWVLEQWRSHTKLEIAVIWEVWKLEVVSFAVSKYSLLQSWFPAPLYILYTQLMCLGQLWEARTGKWSSSDGRRDNICRVICIFHEWGSHHRYCTYAQVFLSSFRGHKRWFFFGKEVRNLFPLTLL